MSMQTATAQNLAPDGAAAAPAHLALARSLETLGRFHEAEDAYASAARSDPQSLDAQLGLARLAFQLAHVETAFDAADAALALDGENVAAWRMIAEILHTMGEAGYAAQACARAADLAPQDADLRVRAGQLFEAAERPFDAAGAYRQALLLGPSRAASLAAHTSLSALHGRALQFDRARAHAEAALAIEPQHQGAWQNLAAICDHEGLFADAEHCRWRAYGGRAVVTERAPEPRRRALMLASGGRVHTPDRYLVPAARYDRLVWFVSYGEGPPPGDYDVVFNAVAEPDAQAALSETLAAFAETCGRKVLNPPARIGVTRRDAAAALFAGVPGLMVPQTRRVAGAADAGDLEAGDWLLRPVGQHGGEGLERVTHESGKARLGGGAHYLTRFCDFRSPDGFYRKYRLFFVDRVAYPYHLAIGDHWLLHYQSSLTPTRADFREEERLFLENPRAALGDLAFDAMAQVGRRLDLDFAGADFAVLPDGRALLFEANATMFVHDEPLDSPLAYKTAHAQAIQQAFGRMLES